LSTRCPRQPPPGYGGPPKLYAKADDTKGTMGPLRGVIFVFIVHAGPSARSTWFRVHELGSSGPRRAVGSSSQSRGNIPHRRATSDRRSWRKPAQSADRSAGPRYASSLIVGARPSVRVELADRERDESSRHEIQPGCAPIRRRGSTRASGKAPTLHQATIASSNSRASSSGPAGRGDSFVTRC
jgi:hypothetical protein